MLTLTENALTAVRRFIQGSDKPVAGLRVMVTGGGCSGMQYGMRLEEAVTETDQIFEFGDISVMVDPSSAEMLAGVTVDFVDSMEGAGFKFDNPNAKASCGCGNSFSC
jgi:iron-sulfur cluster assembly protein